MAEGGRVQLQQPASNEYSNLLNEGQDHVSTEQPVPQHEWYLGLLATLCTHYSHIRDLCGSRWCALSGGKLEAFLCCLCLPFTVIIQAVNEQRAYLRQSGIVYLYLFLSITVVVNLVVPLREIDAPVAENIQLYFVLGCTVLAIVGMLYLWLFTRETLTYHDWNLRAGYPPEGLMRVFYQGGLYLFGFLSFGYSLSIAMDRISCDEKVVPTVNIMKALYIVVQTVFLNKFYKGRIPDDTRWIQIVLAHLLGTNVALWFWTLCSEEMGESTECNSHPIPLRNTAKIFSPLFVEYLLIAASLFYQIWKDLLPTQAVSAPHCRTCACQMYAENVDAGQQLEVGRGLDRVRVVRSRNSGLGIVLGCSFGVMFLVVVIASAATGETHQIYHVAYSGGIITLYLMQIFACYIILLSAQSLAWDRKRNPLDHDDALLYISLVGLLLWEGFHLYSLVLTEFDSETDSLSHSNVRHMDIAADILGMLQFLFQTTTLINLRRHQPTRGQTTTWISQCALFLLTTNFVLWILDSFFIQIIIKNPGEDATSIQRSLEPMGYILHPLSIFFRFHSAVYCLISWSIFKT